MDVGREEGKKEKMKERKDYGKKEGRVIWGRTIEGQRDGGGGEREREEKEGLILDMFHGTRKKKTIRPTETQNTTRVP
jgi:hypothetical protein